MESLVVLKTLGTVASMLYEMKVFEIQRRYRLLVECWTVSC